jgi:transposase
MKKVQEEATEGIQVKPRRKFDPVFKEETVAMWLRSGKTARQISAELGISESRLFEWKRKYAPASPAAKAQQENELAALRHENAILREQRDILKKTLGIISETPKEASNGSTR